MRVREPVGGRGWLLTDLTCGFWNVVWQATKQDACHATGTGPQRGHSLNYQYGLQLMIEQSPQQRDGDGQLSDITRPERHRAHWLP